MQVELSPEAAALVQKWMDEGYGSPEAVVELAVRALGEPVEVPAEELRRLIEQGLESLEKHGSRPAEESLARARQMIEERLTAERRSA